MKCLRVMWFLGLQRSLAMLIVAVPEVVKLFKEMVVLAIHGFVEKALAHFHLMQTTGTEPEDITFIRVLSAYSHGGNSNTILATDARTKSKVEAFSKSHDSFFKSWAKSFVRLSNIFVKTGNAASEEEGVHSEGDAVISESDEWYQNVEHDENEGDSESDLDYVDEEERHDGSESDEMKAEIEL
ncbi:hypothetical protein Cni_G22086 [Canna indica]|uniref:Uncharacterized protein n=1 Tax=Canna indica TaxID=4628 RepID=A0AAQ3KW53_9LILI|nr:hypothetical protein Cni_G22086 [Canna indica]